MIELGVKTKVIFKLGDAQIECRRFTLSEQLEAEEAVSSGKIKNIFPLIAKVGFPEDVLMSLELPEALKVIESILGKKN